MTDTDDKASASPELSVALGDDHVATLEFSRPPSNYFSVSLISQIADACDELAAGGRCRSPGSGCCLRAVRARAWGRPAFRSAAGEAGRAPLRDSDQALFPVRGLHEPLLLGALACHRRARLIGELAAHRRANRANCQGR